MNITDKQKKVLWVMLGLIVGLKGAFLSVYGPLHLPDSGGYTSFADLILNTSEWAHSVDLNIIWYPETAFRSIGYPAVIALAKIVSAQSYDWLIILVQFSLSLVTSFLVFCLALCLCERFWLAAFCALAHAISQGMLMDQCILTDSFNSSLLISLICLLGMGILQNQRPTYGKMFGLGFLIALAFLIREAGNQLQYLYWPFALYWIYKSSDKGVRKFMLFVCFIAPMIVFTQSYKSWNEYRTGERFITTAGQTTMYFPALELKERGINPFAEDEYLKDLEPYYQPLDQVPQLRNVSVINHHLSQKHGMNAHDISRYAFKKFFGYWVDYPLSMIQVMASRLRSKQFFLSFMPFETMMKIDFWSTGIKPFQKKGDLFEKVKQDQRYDLLAAYLGRQVGRIISGAIMITFIIALPVLFLRRLKKTQGRLGELDQKEILIFMFWLIYIGYTCAFAMVHLEQRYLLPVVPLSVMSALYILRGVLDKLWVKISSLKSK